MKTRNGFISNSSSSSFILMMKEVSVSDLNDNLILGDSNAVFYAQGGILGEGLDFFQLDTKMKKFILKHHDNHPNRLSFYLVYWKSAANEFTINREIWSKIGNCIPVNQNAQIHTLEISYHISDDISMMRERYFPDVIDGEEQRQKEVAEYNRLKENITIEKEKTKKMEEELKQKQKKLKIKEV